MYHPRKGTSPWVFHHHSPSKEITDKGFLPAALSAAEESKLHSKASPGQFSPVSTSIPTKQPEPSGISNAFPSWGNLGRGSTHPCSRSPIVTITYILPLLHILNSLILLAPLLASVNLVTWPRPSSFKVWVLEHHTFLSQDCCMCLFIVNMEKGTHKTCPPPKNSPPHLYCVRASLFPKDQVSYPCQVGSDINKTLPGSPGRNILLPECVETPTFIRLFPVVFISLMSFLTYLFTCYLFQVEPLTC